MKKLVIIPTYWGRHKDEGWREGDAVYDHPTPVNEKGTLGRILESMKNLKSNDYQLALIVCPTCKEVENQAFNNVLDIVRHSGLNVSTYILTSGVLEDIYFTFSDYDEVLQAERILSFFGYPNVRNICLLAAELMDAEAAILIDDDEVFELDDFIERGVENLGLCINGKTVRAIAGYYLNKHGTYYDDVIIQPWMTYWDRFSCKAKAFDQIIGSEPRLKRTPFAFGGAMVIHRTLFRKVPFDPEITRGEDIDYLLNSEMFGDPFYLDNTLSIKHLPEPKEHPEWKRVREDIYRFVYQKAKLKTQKNRQNMTEVKPEFYDPYPGEFLKDDLEEKIFKSNMMLSQYYLGEGDIQGSRESLKNIYIAKNEAVPAFNAFERYCQTQSIWKNFMDILAKKPKLKANLARKYQIDKSDLKND